MPHLPWLLPGLLALPGAQQSSAEARQQFMEGKEHLTSSSESWSPGDLETWAPVLDLLLAFQLLELGEVASLASFSFSSLKSQGCSRSLLFKMS